MSDTESTTALEALAEWIEELAARGSSTDTLRGYQRHVRAALRDIARARDEDPEALLLTKLTRRDLRSHLARWRSSPDRRYRDASDAPRERSGASLRARAQALRAFARWCAEEGLCADFSAGIQVAPERASSRTTPSLGDVERLLEAAASGRNSSRDLLLVTLLATHGCSLAELSGVAHTALDLEEGVLVLAGKSTGGPARSRTLRLSPRAQEAAAGWLRQRERYVAALSGTPPVPLFILRDGRGLSSDKLTRIIARVARRAGVEATSQSIRASFATLALQAGSSVTSVQHSLGLRSLTALRTLVGEGERATAPLHPLST